MFINFFLYLEFRIILISKEVTYIFFSEEKALDFLQQKFGAILCS